jgi:hypothetical protein
VAELQVTFVDTNVLAYAYDRSETDKQPVAQAQLEVLWRSRTGPPGGPADRRRQDHEPLRLSGPVV